MTEAPSKPRRFQFGLRALVLATFGIGALSVVLYFYDEWRSTSLGEYNIVDSHGNPWRVDVRFMNTSSSTPPGRRPKIFLIAYSTTGQVVRYRYSTYWRLGIGKVRPIANGIGVYQYPYYIPGVSFELKDGVWRVTSESDYAYKSFHQMLDENVEPDWVFDLPANSEMDVDEFDANGQTALHRAVALSKEAYIYLLIRHYQANVLHKDRNGRTIFDLETSPRISAMLKALQEKDLKLFDELGDQIRRDMQGR